MSLPDHPADLAVERATRDFAGSLGRHDLLHQAARLEATLYPTGDGRLFGLDHALAAAWPADAPPPAYEVIVARAGGELLGLKLSVFDDQGRVLLRRHYMADASGEVRSAEASRKAGGAHV